MLAAYWQREEGQQRLEALLVAKDEFIASVSHELRTPLSVVVGLAAELRDGRIETSEQREVVGLLATQSMEMAELVEDLLVAARSEDARLTVLPARVDLGELVGEVLSGLPDRNGSAVEVELTPGVGAWADPLRVRQVVRNLVMNAIRHGGEHIWVRTGVRGGEAWLTVEDDGPGIPAEQVEEMFEPYRTASRVVGRTPSIGLGLAVSRRLARMMEGDVAYRREDERAVFELTLPRR